MTNLLEKIPLNIAKTKVKVNGKNGLIIHSGLLADGPVDAITGEPLINPATNDVYPGKNDDLIEILESYLLDLNGSVQIYTENGNPTVPRYGVLGLLAKSTPIYMYDHPRFKKIANTAFTDGINVYLDADFVRKLVKEEEKEPSKSGLQFLILHELMHKLFNHNRRLKSFPHDIANIAEDMVINGRLRTGYKLNPVPLLENTGVGMKDEDAKKYSNMAEEVVAEMLLANQRKQEEQKKKGGKGKSQGQGQGQGQGEPSSGGEPSGEQEENGNPENTENGDEEYSPIHHITAEEMIEILEEEGLTDTVGEALNMPKPNDVDGLARKKQTNELQIVEAIEGAVSMGAGLGDKMPGGHIAEAAAETIKGLHRGKLTWKLGIRKHIIGDGLRLKHSDDEADTPWFLTKKTLGVKPWYSGALVPHKPDEVVLCILDTSGSTSFGNMRKEFISEALTLKKGVSTQGDTASEVVLISADTRLRGEPLVINEHNVDKLMDTGVQIFGNGGTDFARCLEDALNHKILNKKKIKSVIYFTDCCDAVPQRKDFEKYLEKGMKVVFVTVPSMWNEAWNKELTWAEVYCMDENTVVDLDKKEVSTNTRRNKK